MKHLKTFEQNNSIYYWLLPTDDRFEQSLYDIGVNQKDTEIFIGNITIRYPKYVFIVKNTTSRIDPWAFLTVSFNSMDIPSLKLNFDNDYIFKGTINLTPEENEMVNMGDNINDFNL